MKFNLKIAYLKYNSLQNIIFFQNSSYLYDFISLLFYNVVSLSKTESFPSWNIFINTPAPNNYNNEDYLFTKIVIEPIKNLYHS